MIIPLIFLLCMLSAAVLVTQPDYVGYTIVCGSAAFALLTATMLWRSLSRSLNKPGQKLEPVRLAPLLVLWIALTGIAIPEQLTFGSRTSGSDYVLAILVIVLTLTALKQGSAIFPPQARPLMFLGLWIATISLIHGTVRVGTMQIGIVLSALMGLSVGYATVCVVYKGVPNLLSARQVILTFVVCASIWNIIAIAAFFLSGTGERLGYATLLNPNAYGAFVGVALISQFAQLLFEGKHPVLSLANTMLLSLGLVLSGSKAAWGGVLLALVGFLIFGNVRARFILLGAIGLLLMAGVAIFPLLDSQGWLGELTGHLSSTDRSVDSRLITDSFAISLWTSTPLTILAGTGIGVYVQLYAFFTYLAASSIHNTYLRFLVEQGPLGLIVWLAMSLVALRAMWRQRHRIAPEQRWIVTAVFFAILSVLLQGFVHDIVNQRFFWLFLGLAYAIGDEPRVVQQPSTGTALWRLG
jgi:O-antigen ligase